VGAGSSEVRGDTDRGSHLSAGAEKENKKKGRKERGKGVHGAGWAAVGLLAPGWPSWAALPSFLFFSNFCFSGSFYNFCI
jgi:hypothetical protein